MAERHNHIAVLGELIRLGLETGRERPIVEQLCKSLTRCGVGLHRVAVGSDLLHPLFGARGIIWTEQEGISVEDYGRNNEKKDQWLRSPFHHMLQNELRLFHVPLDNSLRPDLFPLLDRLKERGCTDYFAVMVEFGANSTLGDLQGLIWSFATQKMGGFSDDQIETIEMFVPAASLALKSANANVTGRVLMDTYLGQDAGRRVVSGAIDRGATESVTAALWFSDLEGFTRLADALPQDQVIALLNDYAETIVTIIHANQGQVLKFMGDGILAMFPFDGHDDACRHALEAASQLGPSIDVLNKARERHDLPTTDVYLGLHVGEVLYGNIGSRGRLDFTVVGPAVNEVVRIERLSRSLEQHVAISAAFAELAPELSHRLVSLGRYMLKGVGRPQEMFTLDPETERSSSFAINGQDHSDQPLAIEGDALVT